MLLTIETVLLILAALFLASEWVQLAFAVEPTRRHWLGVVFPLMLGGALVCLLIAYILGRKGHGTVSSLLVIGVTMVASYWTILITKSSDTLGFPIIGVVLCSVLLSRRLTLVVLALTISATLAVPIVVPEISYWNATSALFLILPVGALSLLSAVIHDRDLEQIEGQTQTLIKNQEKILGARKMEAIARLSAGIAHEFNNIAMAIVGYSEVIASSSADSVLRYSQLIRSAGLRAGRLTGQLLSFSRQQLLHPRAIDLNQLVRELEHVLRSMLDEKIRLSVQLDPEPNVAYVDPDLLGQVVQTLCIKARDNMPEGGKISVATKVVVVPQDRAQPSFPPGPYCAISISDTGPLVDSEVLARIFDPFFTKGEFGTGDLDLAAAYGIITQSDGRIDVNSTSEHGNTFEVLLPRREGKVS